MLEAICAFLSQSVECKNWGFNTLTISALGTAVFTFVEGWGVVEQIRTIFRKQSGESVSVNFFVYVTVAFLMYLIYGIHIGSLSMVFNGVLAIPQLPILYGLWLFKGFTKDNWVMIGFGTLLCILFFATPYKTQIFALTSVGVVAFMGLIPYEIWKTGTRGAADIKMILAYLTSTIFWVGFAYGTADPVLRISTPITLFLLTLAAVLWYRCEEDPALTAAT